MRRSLTYSGDWVWSEMTVLLWLVSAVTKTSDDWKTDSERCMDFNSLELVIGLFHRPVYFTVLSLEQVSYTHEQIFFSKTCHFGCKQRALGNILKQESLNRNWIRFLWRCFCCTEVKSYMFSCNTLLLTGKLLKLKLHFLILSIDILLTFRSLMYRRTMEWHRSTNVTCSGKTGNKRQVSH